MSAYLAAEAVFRETIAKEGMLPLLDGGALVALSGGKDSVLLLSLFSSYAKENNIPVFALHVHHGIRGDEADADAAFCEELCQALDVPFLLARTDVPRLAEARHEGIEETARKERYRLLCDAAKAHGVRAVLTAHSATDQVETVLLHLLRGGGGNGLCGMPFVRPLAEELFLLRPLLMLPCDKIEEALASRGLPCVFDSTNLDNTLRRNYVRQELLPRLSHITPSPERAVLRMTQNLREDMAFLDDMALAAYAEVACVGGLKTEALCALAYPIGYRVFRIFYDKHKPTSPRPEQVHVRALFDRLRENGRFTLSFPGGVSLAVSDGVLRFEEEKGFSHPHTPVQIGCNILADGSYLWLLEESSKSLPQIVYTLAIRRTLASVKMEGELYVRSRAEGDSYFYGGMTHKLKKLFSDRKMPLLARKMLPVLCDERGIVWVPSFGARDDGVKNERPLVALYLAKEKIPEGFSQLLSDAQA